jgi:hypothetical protein
MFSVVFGKLKGLQGYLKLPIWVNVGLFLISIIVLTALSLAFGKVNMTIC